MPMHVKTSSCNRDFLYLTMYSRYSLRLASGEFSSTLGTRFHLIVIAVRSTESKVTLGGGMLFSAERKKVEY